MKKMRKLYRYIDVMIEVRSKKRKGKIRIKKGRLVSERKKERKKERNGEE